MAHECPVCGLPCRCGTDIDDLLLNDEMDICSCTHCPDDDDGPHGPGFPLVATPCPHCARTRPKPRMCPTCEAWMWRKHKMERMATR